MQRIRQIELGLMFVLFNFSTAAGFLIGPLTSTAGYQGWVSIFIAHTGGLLIACLSIAYVKKRQNEFLIHYGKEVVGRWINFIMMVIYAFFFIHLAGIVLRQATDFLVQIYLPSTPAWVIASSFGLVIAIAVRSGIEAIFRCAAGFFFVIFSTATLVPFLVGKELDYHRGIALLTNLSLGDLVQTSYPFVPWFGEMFLVIFIFPFLANAEKTPRTLLWSSMISLLFFEVYFLLCILLFDETLMAHFTYPILEMLRFIRIGDFLENLDPIVVAIWIAGLFIKISILLYMAVFISSQLLQLKDSRPLSFSIGAVMVGMSMHSVKNLIELNHFITHAWVNFAYFIECSPLIYWAISVVRGRFLSRAQGGKDAV
ncbi:GerAB/ArcD/ProY family transporter [Paenibacillus sp. GCM10023248]|uniref:GerAB/ArcD/ProY family transporter n=1 Tax=unclassified Paenibacillus TaxID=185978 RepID=UPI0023798065|nr:GerAB/ArcD/ProY family transporter [Paenibacillus sp. MAHUQ-63]MDD9265563.1 GerAB/ArcD/ProY family transporter [Paenibacillus sp. MAHUQ-63]